jgi:hypothetical protein
MHASFRTPKAPPNMDVGEYDYFYYSNCVTETTSKSVEYQAFPSQINTQETI